MRIAYFTPLSPQHGGISDHSEELLPHLAPYADIDVMVSGAYSPSNPAIIERFPIRLYREYLRDPQSYDAAVYQVGNNLRAHAYMLPCLRAAPGIIVLQDYCLQYLTLGLTLGRGEVDTLIHALRPVYGPAAERLARRLLLSLEDPGGLSFAHPFLAASRAVIVHSGLVERLVRDQLPAKPVRNVPMGVSSPTGGVSKCELRQRHGYRRDEFIVASVSTRAPKKRLEVVLEALREARSHGHEIRLLVVGGGSPGAKVHRMIRDYGLSEVVDQTGWVAAERYQELIRLSDVAVDMRDMTAAETAHSALRCLAAGTPVIVSGSGTFVELPDSCCPKIPPEGDQARELAALLGTLAREPRRVGELAAAAQDFARQRLTLELQAREFMAFVGEVAATTPGSGPVELLEPRPGRSKRLKAALYKASRAASLMRRYGAADSVRRLRLSLASRLRWRKREII